MSKPREWYIAESDDGYRDMVVPRDNQSDRLYSKEKDVILVIEKSAYDALAAEVEHTSNTAAQIAKVNIELRAENEKLNKDIKLLVDPIWFEYKKGETGVCGWCDCGDAGYETAADGHDKECPVSRHHLSLGDTSIWTEKEIELIDELHKLRAENEKLKSNVIDVYNNPLHVELFAGAQRLANDILLPELEKQVEDLRTAQAELKDNLKVTNELFEAASEDIGELQSTNAELVEALKEARFVFEGSRAIDGQSDELLDKREGSIMRFLESLAKYGGRK